MSKVRDEDIPMNTMIMVTHLIEEAVELADRVLLFKSRPGILCDDVAVPLARPRDKRIEDFSKMVDLIFEKIA